MYVRQSYSFCANFVKAARLLKTPHIIHCLRAITFLETRDDRELYTTINACFHHVLQQLEWWASCKFLETYVGIKRHLSLWSTSYKVNFKRIRTQHGYDAILVMMCTCDDAFRIRIESWMSSIGLRLPSYKRWCSLITELCATISCCFALYVTKDTSSQSSLYHKISLGKISITNHLPSWESVQSLASWW